MTGPKIGIISLTSDLHDPTSIEQASRPIINGLKESFTLEEIDPTDINKVDVPIILINTGGTEHKFKELFPIIKMSGKPVTLLAGNSNNSLPAALEILSWINQKGLRNNLLLHGPLEEIKEKIKKRALLFDVVNKIRATRLGVIGRPSNWLIAGEVDYQKVMARWHAAIIYIELKKVFKHIEEIPDETVAKITGEIANAQYREGVDQKDIDGALKIYLALKNVIEDFKLSDLTLRCFDFLNTIKNTGCLALARLNDEGITAGCEGDIPAAFTMLINRLITGKPAFMANPSRIEGGRITLAHCTVPTSIVESFGFKTHFESGLGVGIAGNFKEGPVTISKIGGQALDRFYVVEGTLIADAKSDNLCRTQVTIKVDQGLDYFFTEPLGNHHIVSPGNNAQFFREVMAFFDCKSVNSFAGKNCG